MGGEATCVGGRLQRSLSVSDDEYSREVVVRSLRAPAGLLEQYDVQGPGGSVTLRGGGPPVPFSGPLVGTWTIIRTVSPPCTATAGGRFLIGMLAEVGCP